MFLDRPANERNERSGIAHATVQIEIGDGTECRLAASNVV
jgi:hypothetical protein